MEDVWPSSDAYALARRCPRCGAEPGKPCTYRGSTSTVHTHAPRIDAAVRP